VSDEQRFQETLQAVFGPRCAEFQPGLRELLRQLHHWDEINEYKHTHEGITWGEAADAIILPKLKKKEET